MHPQHIRPAGSQSATVYKSRIDSMAKVYERFLGAFAAHEQTVGSPAPDLTVRVESGPILAGYGSPSERALIEITAQTVSGFTIPSVGTHRVDRVVINETTGAASRVAGTAVTGSPSATPPAIPAGCVPCCRVLIQDTDTVITNSMITDERSFGDLTRGMLRACDGADFNPVSDHASLTGSPSGLAGSVNSKKGTFFVHMRVDGLGAGARTIMEAKDASQLVFRAALNGSGTLAITCGSGSNVRVTSVSTYAPSSTWLSALASWDTGGGGSPSGVAWLRVQDTVQTTIVALQPDYTILYSNILSVALGSLVGASERWDGCLAELWFAPGQYIEDTEDNRRKFYSASGKPIHLGARGERPTGTPPLIYLHLDDGEAPANFLIDRSGYGNTFTLPGSPAELHTASTSPSD